MENDKDAGRWQAILQIFDAVWQWEGSGPVVKYLLIAALAVGAVAFMLTALVAAITKLVDALAKGGQWYKSSGLPLPMSREAKQQVRQRSQFCSVLWADLAQLAKSESWNDQWFTDLEAEVESEGGYYASSLHRLLRRSSHGLRKERSLIRAITRSTERAVQLVGEPGAGKSVALRHLATELAANGRRSKSENCLVPLYINLRELPSDGDGSITADGIRNFIFDNIRRGDSDTSAFVRANWDDYRDRGVWFFLFDSFDEIPGVLHAEQGSAAQPRRPTRMRSGSSLREWVRVKECSPLANSRVPKHCHGTSFESCR